MWPEKPMLLRRCLLIAFHLLVASASWSISCADDGQLDQAELFKEPTLPHVPSLIEFSFNRLNSVLRRRAGGDQQSVASRPEQLLEELDKSVGGFMYPSRRAIELLKSIVAALNSSRDCNQQLLELIRQLDLGSKRNPAYAGHLGDPKATAGDAATKPTNLRPVDELANYFGSLAASRCNEQLNAEYDRLMGQLEEERLLNLGSISSEEPRFKTWKAGAWLARPKFDFSPMKWKQLIRLLVDQNDSRNLYGQRLYKPVRQSNSLVISEQKLISHEANYVYLIDRYVFGPCKYHNDLFGKFVRQFYSVGDYILEDQSPIKPRVAFLLEGRPTGLLDTIYRYELCRSAGADLNYTGESSVFRLLASEDQSNAKNNLIIGRQ